MKQFGYAVLGLVVLLAAAAVGLPFVVDLNDHKGEISAALKAATGRDCQPLRIAVSGGTVSPAIFDTLAILGREAVVKRIARCLACREELFNKSQA